MDKLYYPVLFKETTDGYLATIPDIDQSIHADTLEEAFREAEELLGLWIAAYLDNERPVTEYRKPVFDYPDDVLVVYMKANTKKYRNKYKDLRKDDEDEQQL